MARSLPDSAGVDPGTLLATTHPLPNGERVRLRLTRPSDAARVEAFLDGLSQETRARRFFTGAPPSTAAQVRHFTNYDPRERLVIAACLFADGAERLVGIGDLALHATGQADLALVVADGAQGEGVGTLLARALATLALRRGVERLRAETIEPSAAMNRIMERLGTTVRSIEDGRSVLYTRLDAAGPRAA
jgi:RimJ/RimL family protein N-acetyltransferase